MLVDQLRVVGRKGSRLLCEFVEEECEGKQENYA
jgi:hypothetical protein